MNKEEIESLMARVKENEANSLIHVSYSEKTGRDPDFMVDYNLCSNLDEIGIKPGQGMRCDFLYDGEDRKTEGVHMIYPEVLDSSGAIITDKGATLDKSGKAYMWIIDDKNRAFHRGKIKVGTKGAWVTGPYRIADIVVTRLLGLENND